MTSKDKVLWVGVATMFVFGFAFGIQLVFGVLTAVGIFGVLSFLLSLPLDALFRMMGRLWKPTLLAHVFVNLLFLGWAYYDLHFTTHYGHGPNTLFIVFPGLLAFSFFYFFYLWKKHREFAEANRGMRWLMSLANIMMFVLWSI